MAILNTAKKFMLYAQETTGHVLYRLASQCIEMDNGNDLQTEINTINNNLTDKGSTASIGNYGIEWILTTSYKNIAGNEIRNTNTDVFEIKNNAIYINKAGYYYVSAQTNCHVVTNGNNTIWMKVVKNSSDVLSAQGYVYNGYITVNTQGVVWCEVGDYLDVMVSASVASAIKCSGQDKLTLIKL